MAMRAAFRVPMFLRADAASAHGTAAVRTRTKTRRALWSASFDSPRVDVSIIREFWFSRDALTWCKPLKHSKVAVTRA